MQNTKLFSCEMLVIFKIKNTRLNSVKKHVPNRSIGKFSVYTYMNHTGLHVMLMIQLCRAFSEDRILPSKCYILKSTFFSPGYDVAGMKCYFIAGNRQNIPAGRCLVF